MVDFLASALTLALVQVATPAVPGVALERRVAERFSLRVGDTVAIASDATAPTRPFLVEAIYQPRPDPATTLRGELLARFHLTDLAGLLGAIDRIDRVGIRVRAPVSVDSAVTRLNQQALGFRAWPSATVASESSRTFLVVSRFHRAIALIAIVASAVFLLCIMLLKVEERRLDAAVMRMIGLTRVTVFKSVVLEATMIAAVGSGLGIGLAALASAITNAVYRRRFETPLTFAYLSGDIVLIGVAISLALGVIVGAAAAGRLVRANPLALWRRVE